jgi:hypothetical protein
MGEHVYDFRGEIHMVMAGPGSYRNFRVNFRKRLAEVFANFNVRLAIPRT